MAGDQVPVLTLDFDDEKIRTLNEIAEKFKNALRIGPGGLPLPEQPQQSQPTTMPQPVPSVPPSEPAAKPPATKPAPKGNGGKKPSAETAFDKFMKSLNKETKATLKTFTLINKTLGATTDTLKNLFTTTVSWGAKIAAISGGGFLGYGFMARHVSDQYKAAQGMGLTTGQMQAANNVYGTRISGVGNIMQTLAAAQNDPSNPSYAGLVNLGINPQDGAAVNMPKLFSRVSQLLEQYKGTGVSQTILKANGLDGLIDVASANQVLANSGRMPLLNQQFGEQSQRLDRDLGSGSQQSFQDLTAKFLTNADRIGNTFINALAKLNGPIGRISDELTSDIEKFLNGRNGKALFDTVAHGLEKLGNWLASDDFQKDLKTFADCVKDIAHVIGEAINWIAGVVPGVQPDGAGKGASQVNPILKQYGDKYLGGMLPGSNPETGKYTGIWSDKDIFDRHGKGYKMTNSQQAEFKTRFDQTTKDNHLPDGLLGAVAMQESSGNPLAYNKKSGAAGWFQFTTPTAAGYGLSSMDRFDPAKSLNAAGRYFSDNLKHYHGDIAESLAQYNGGNKAVRSDGTLSLKKETVEYLLKILPKVEGGIEQHPGIMRQLEAADAALSKGGINDRATIHLEIGQKPGSDISAQVKGVYNMPR